VPPIRSLLARIRALPAWRADALLAGVLLAEAIAELFLSAQVDRSRLAAVAGVVTVMAAGLAVRRRFPLLALLVVLGLQPVLQSFGPALAEHIAGPFFWVPIAGYSLGAHTEGRRLWAGVLYACVAVTLSTVVEPYEDDVTAYVSSVCLVAIGPILFGQALRNRTRLNEALHAKADRAERERAAAADAAALAERTRIAGELHDVVAHALSAMTVQASAARRMAERDPERAESAFATVEATGREALTELRRLLGVLRREDEDLGLAPQPSLAHITSLVDGQDPRGAHADEARAARPGPGRGARLRARRGDPGPGRGLASRSCCTSRSHPTASAGKASSSAITRRARARGAAWAGAG
jgi:signal transduction histidine kinase